MLNLENLKLVIYDFDETLCIHTNRKSGLDIDYDSQVVAGKSAWDTCNPNKSMKQFIDICKKRGITQGLISATLSYQHMHLKNEWVKENYDIELENYCVGHPEDKIKMLRALSVGLGLNKDEILIVDDMYSTLSSAANEGFQSATPMEVVNYIDIYNEGYNEELSRR